MISVIIPTWNDFDWLPDCLESIAKQDVAKEIIIVDDGSKDKTERRLRKEVTIPHIYHRIEHSGVAKAANEGFKLSKGEYLIFADADMVFNSDCFKTMLEALEKNPDCSFAYCNSKWTDIVKGESGTVVQDIVWDTERLKISNYIDKCSLLRREAFEEFGGFDETLERLVDWDMWLTLVGKGRKGCHIPRTLYTKYLRPDGISARSREDYIKWHTRIQEKHKIYERMPNL